MNRNKLKTYAPQARKDFIRAVTDRAAVYGLTKKIEPVTVQGDVAIIGGRSFPADVAPKRKALEERIGREGFEQVMEMVAYTWFNRLVALRYMELHGYLDHGYRVLSHPEGKPTPEIVEHAEHVDLPGLNRDEVIHLKLDGTKEAELYRKLLIAQCNALHAAMPFLFERIADETELLLPDSLLHSDSLVRKLVTGIDEADWQEVEIIGWLYQFYISEKKAEVIGSVVKSEDIPAATQLFTPNWIVKYLVQNSLGRQWLATYPDSPLKAKMAFYIEPAEQTPEVQAQLKDITPESLNPEELTFLDPACGSGHILVEAYSLLKDIYLERGYRLRDIPKLILTKNLFGLEIDDRAAQLAAFALLMMARADDRNILSPGVTPNVLAIQQTDHLDTEVLLRASAHTKLPAKPQPASDEFGFMDEVRAPLYANSPAPKPNPDPLVADLRQLLDFFNGAKTFGSLLEVPPALAAKLPALRERLTALQQSADLTTAGVGILDHLVRQADLLSRRYGFVAANPPYMGRKGMNPTLATLAKREFPRAKHDLFSMFVERGLAFAQSREGILAMVVMESWMFLTSFEDFRETLLQSLTLTTLTHMPYEGRGRTTMGIAFGTCAFAAYATTMSQYKSQFSCVRYTDLDDEARPLTFPVVNSRLCHVSASDFQKVPGQPISYWLSNAARACFKRFPPLRAVAEPQVGLQTSDSDRFIRFWFEVAATNVGFGCSTNEEAASTGCKWFPLDKGGDFRRWYGNTLHIANWKNNGQEIKAFVAARYPYLNGNTDYVVKDRGYFFRPGVTWNKITSAEFSARASFAGAIFSDAGMKVPCDEPLLSELCGYLNSSVATYFLEALSPTMNSEKGTVALIPFLKGCADTDAARQAVGICREEWDESETSFQFSAPPVLSLREDGRVESSVAAVISRTEARRSELHRLEEANNKRFAEAYGIDGEVATQVEVDRLSIKSVGVREIAQSLLSFVVGCAMGRYSLDKPGLIYAHSGNEGFDPAAYATFPADKDGIIPVTEEHWFSDDAAARFEEFVSKAWPAEHLDETLAFVAEGLGAKKNESPRQTIRRYLSDGFYKHHLSKSMYKNRPIYWLFTSGKQRAFQALVYLHRYNEGTLSRMRTAYVIPLQSKIKTRIEQLEEDKEKATSTAHRRKMEKEQDKLRKQDRELADFDEKLRHYADQRINLDLDDGVKVNYGKFGDLLAEVKKVTGEKAVVD